MQKLNESYKLFLIFFVIFLILIPFTYGGIYHINYEVHYKRAINLFNNHSHINGYPMMFVCLKTVSKITNYFNLDLDWKHIFTIVIVPAYFFRILFIYLYCRFKDLNSIKSIMIACSTIIIFTPFYNYLGRYTFFHLNDPADPTTLFSYPFALALYFFTIKKLDKILETKNFIIFIILLSLSIFSKPTYAISFLPGLFIFIFFKNFSNLKDFYTCFKTQILFILISSFLLLGISGFVITSGYYSIDLNPMAGWLIRTNGNYVLLLYHWIISLSMPIAFFLKQYL